MASPAGQISPVCAHVPNLCDKLGELHTSTSRFLAGPGASAWQARPPPQCRNIAAGHEEPQQAITGTQSHVD